jgi:hypothetical protein
LNQIGIDKIPKMLWVFIISIGVIVSYNYAVDIMKTQIIADRVSISNVTFNLILLYFIWGMMADKISKRKGWDEHKNTKWKGYALAVFGCIMLGMFFRFVGGYETIFG